MIRSFRFGEEVGLPLLIVTLSLSLENGEFTDGEEFLI